MSIPTLEPGLAHVITTTVDAAASPPHLAPVILLATPEMIRLMEQAATEAVAPYLEDSGKTTVGTHVDVSHESVAAEHEEVTVTAELTSVDGRRLTFHVEARVGERIIGRGNHRRHIVDRSFGS